MPSPWNKQKCVIECCYNCVPPKRYPGCGANCQEYKDEKARYLIEKERKREIEKREHDVRGYFVNKAKRIKHLRGES